MNVIEVSHLEKRYGEIHAVNDLSFHVEEGELFGFLGINGAGKSTTIQMLCTLLEKDGGEAYICGHPLSDTKAIRNLIGVVAQHNCLDEELSVMENMIVRASLYGANLKQIKKRVKQLSGLFELEELLHRRYGRLSGGQKRKCEIAAALLHDPKILFLDEPTTGLDPATRKNVWKCIEQLRSQFHMSVFLTTHYMEEAAMANHIAIINHGKLLEYGTPHELKDTYGKDRLLLFSKELDQLQNKLTQQGIVSQQQEDHLQVFLAHTIEALPILKEVEPLLHGFEVIQGTMDDVFLRVCGKPTEEEMK